MWYRFRGAAILPNAASGRDKVHGHTVHLSSVHGHWVAPMVMSGHQAKASRTSPFALLHLQFTLHRCSSVSVVSLVRASPQQPAPAQLGQPCPRGNSTHFHVLFCFTQVALKRRRTLRVTFAWHHTYPGTQLLVFIFWLRAAQRAKH